MAFERAKPLDPADGGCLERGVIRETLHLVLLLIALRIVILLHLLLLLSERCSLGSLYLLLLLLLSCHFGHNIGIHFCFYFSLFFISFALL